jgi:U-box domain
MNDHQAQTNGTSGVNRYNVTDVANAYGVKIPDQYICPITMEVMKQPVQSIYGHNFEHNAIEKWLRNYSCCPLTRRPLTNSDIKSNGVLLGEIVQWIFYYCLYAHDGTQQPHPKRK